MQFVNHRYVHGDPAASLAVHSALARIRLGIASDDFETVAAHAAATTIYGSLSRKLEMLAAEVVIFWTLAMLFVSIAKLM